MSEKPINGTRGWSILVTSVIASLMGSGSGVYVYMHNIGAEQLQAVARPDPATGSELRMLRDKVNTHLLNHPDIINQFDRRITRIETLLEIIAANQQRILHQEPASP